MMKTLSLHMQINNGVSTNMGIVYVTPVHDNRIRYKFFNLEHLLLYIKYIQIQLNINT
jgi:hypothetical protein